MNVRNLIYHNNLRPGDVLVVKKDFLLLSLIDHYMVYMGKDAYGRPWFMANMTKGVSWVSEEEVVDRSGNFTVERIRRFEGNEWQRNEAIARAQSLEGKPYSLWQFNCENFANWVQGKGNYSLQVQKAQQIAQVVGAFALAGIAIGLIGSLLGEE
jgi:hypothetical protein